MSDVAGAPQSGSGVRWSGCLFAVVSVGIAAFNLTTGVFNVFLNGGMLGQLSADAYNHHVPFLEMAGGRLDAVILAGLIALVGCGVALAQFGRRTRRLGIVGVVANVAAMLTVVAAFASGTELGQ